MPSQDFARLAQCNCLALRQAARHVTQFYDQYLASTGLRTTSFRSWRSFTAWDR